ncbi:putative mitotubule-associated protein Gb4 [Trypanosoma cruzi]|uniref:Flagellar attachment zone protein 1 conserved domain-containing protein n=1 Tax=Trypanosoma cruzi TaxID=5693 RepID=A0A2V2VHP5_TRYCR|nr:hypothetical protein BCY84_12120 [Trypanosoma cruzi cruzi]PWU94972.1 hypothetical protein C4B63_24g199 [Trypanosoma cruzi]RNF18964.1 putative mitotubule-associated protein Gb4 [Trypanosoma cruzi]
MVAIYKPVSDCVWHQMPMDVRERIRAFRERAVSREHFHTRNVWSADFINAPPPGMVGRKPGLVAFQERPKRPELLSLGNGLSDGGVAIVQRSSSMSSSKFGKSRHSLHFRGELWESVVKTNEFGLKASFITDVVNATGLDGSRIEDVAFVLTNVLIVTFTVSLPENPERMTEVHAALQRCNFPRTTATYMRHRLAFF